MQSFARCAKWAFVLGLSLSGLGGCSRQGPGERCDTLNGSNDCDDGLVCVPKETLRANASLCCPAGQIGPESIVPGCTYGAGTSTPDSGTVTPTDAAADAADAALADGAADATLADGAADAALADGSPNANDGSLDANADVGASPADGSADAATDAAPADAGPIDAADAGPIDAAADAGD